MLSSARIPLLGINSGHDNESDWDLLVSFVNRKTMATPPCNKED